MNLTLLELSIENNSYIDVLIVSEIEEFLEEKIRL